MAKISRVNTATNAGLIAYTTSLVKSYARTGIWILVTGFGVVAAWKGYKFFKEKKLAKEFTA